MKKWLIRNGARLAIVLIRNIVKATPNKKDDQVYELIVLFYDVAKKAIKGNFNLDNDFDAITKKIEHLKNGS